MKTIPSPTINMIVEGRTRCGGETIWPFNQHKYLHFDNETKYSYKLQKPWEKLGTALIWNSVAILY